MKKIILMALVGLSGLGFAADSNWIGGTSADFNNPANWTNGVPGGSDTAAFGSSGITLLSISTNTLIGAFQFNAGAPAYTIGIAAGSLELGRSTGGIQNLSGVVQTIYVNPLGNFAFDNLSASSVTIANHGSGMLVGNSGHLIVNNYDRSGFYYSFGSAQNSTFSNLGLGSYLTFMSGSNAGQAQIVNHYGGSVSFVDNASAQQANITNDPGDVNGSSIISFQSNSNAGQATITNSTGSFVDFSDSSSGTNSQIYNSGYLWLGNNATAGSANINNGGGNVTFNQNATAGLAWITVNTGTLQFNDHSSASSAIVENITGSTTFSDQATAGQMNTVTWSGAVLNFGDQATASEATIVNTSSGIWPTPGAANFFNNSNAGQAVITDDGGSSNFFDLTTASNSVITNSNSGSVNFSTASSAGSATIINNSGSANFFNVANAGNAVISNTSSSSIIQFNDASNAGNSTLANNGAGLIQFNNISGGGNAAIINNGGTFSITNAVSPQFTVGSIAGNGSFLLGNKSLLTGGNGDDTSVSGVISGSGGSLVKVGTGTLTLSGVNTYSGGTTVAGGALNISNDNNLGLGGGLSLVNGGILETGNALTSNRSITVTGSGAIDSNGFNSTFNGIIQGNGLLIKDGAGTVTVSGSNSYTGGTLVNDGTLKMGATQALPMGTAVMVAGSSSTLDLNGFNQTIGSLSGDGTVAVGTATLTTGTNNLSSSYSGSITGTGSFVKVGSGTLVLAQNDKFAGTTTVQSGDLTFINGAPNSGQTASLGSIGALHNNSSLTPGINGVGTLHVASYSGPGTLNISFNGLSHSSLFVDGIADLTGGKLSITGTRFVTGSYSILSAGSLMGSFSSVDIPALSAFLQIKPNYTPTDVQLNVVSFNFADLAQSANQQKVSSALDAAKGNATGDFAHVVDAIYALPTAEQARVAYNQITGDSIASFQNAGLRSAGAFTHQMMDRSVHGGSLTTAAAAAPVQLAYAGDLVGSALGVDSTPKGPAASSPYGLWSRALGFFDHSDANTSIGSPASKNTTGGFQIGYDIPLDEDVLLGLSGGYAKSSLTVDDRSSSGNSTSVQSGLYASYTPGHWFLNGSMAYTTSSNDMTRSIQFTGVNEQASANFQSRVYTAYVEGGYRYQPRQNSILEPTVSLKESHLHQEAFTETGAPGLNLSVNEQNVNSLVSALGGRLSHRFGAKGPHPLTLGVRAAWEHELASVDNSITAQFAEAPGSSFTVQATPRDRNAAAFGLDGQLPLTESVQAFADYSATLSSGQRAQSIVGGARLKW